MVSFPRSVLTQIAAPWSSEEGGEKNPSVAKSEICFFCASLRVRHRLMSQDHKLKFAISAPELRSLYWCFCLFVFFRLKKLFVLKDKQSFFSLFICLFISATFLSCYIFSCVLQLLNSVVVSFRRFDIFPKWSKIFQNHLPTTESVMTQRCNSSPK